MSLPGFTAQLSFAARNNRHEAGGGRGIGLYARNLVTPQFGFGPGKVTQFCDHDGCYLYVCNSVGCSPVNFGSF